ncbi:MAG: MFS transporter, partial [Saprospiraceae bacterium]|nr:MFS transporter [Saprospiraceae bacterium]
VKLMNFFSSDSSVGVAETFVAMGCIYFLIMMIGVFSVRTPPEGWHPQHFETKVGNRRKLITHANVDADTAIKTPQFWFIFVVLMLNVTAGIGVLGQASVMIQEMFSIEVVGPEKAIGVARAAGFVSLLSLFNMLGRFFWSSISDRIGRKNTYSIFFILGAILYILVPQFGTLGSSLLFIITFCIIMSMYGGGFATVPAYLKDVFGVMHVGAIHGRLLVAWSLAAIIGPTLINYLRAYQIESVGLPPAQAYSFTMYLMAGLLLLGLVSNLLVKPVDEKYHYENQG